MGEVIKGGKVETTVNVEEEKAVEEKADESRKIGEPNSLARTVFAEAKGRFREWFGGQGH